MTNTPDTSPEAAERLASQYEGTECKHGCGTMKFCVCAYAAGYAAALGKSLEAERDRADELGITAVEFSEMAAELVEEMSKRPNTSWGQVKAAIRALGDVGDRQAYNRTTARAEAAEAERDALKEQVANLGRELNTAKYGQPDFAWSLHIAAMDALKAELAEAVETLKTYACKCEPGPNHECAGGDIADCGYRARTFLARHQKETDG